jgi:hypothetical protein
MSLLYRALGIAALFNEVLGAIRWNHIRLNWILLAVLSLVFVDGAVRLESPRVIWPFLHPQTVPVLQMALSSSALVLALISLARRNSIFRPIDLVAEKGGPPPAADPVESQQVDLQVTGRFDRGGGNSVSLINFPCRWHISETGAISLETRVVELGGFDPFRPLGGEASGEWNLLVPRETLTDRLEDGMLYFGISARPAVRLSFPGRRMTATLSVRNVSQRLALRRQFDALLATSADAEKIFYHDLEEKLAQPPPTHKPEPAKARNKSGEGIPWDNLIDFSR